MAQEGEGWNPPGHHTDQGTDDPHGAKIDEELEFFTELALHETERWIQIVTKKKFQYPDDPRKSLENGTLFCELLNAIKPGSIRKINKLPTPIAGLDNLQVFLDACHSQLGLRPSQLFDLHDLEDLSTRAIAECEEQLRAEYDRRLRNVALTVYWLGKTVKKVWDGPQLDFSAFSDLVNRTGVSSPHNSSIFDDSFGEEDDILKNHQRQESADSGDKSSAYGSLPSKTSCEEEDLGTHHTRDNSIESQISCEGTPEKLRSAEMPGRYPEQSWGKAGRYSSAYDADDGYEAYQDEENRHREEYNRFRYNNHAYSSSGDSGDPHSNHSRQSSTISSSSRGDFVPPTRVIERRTTQPAVDPLQFVAVKPKEDLSQKARETMEVMQMQKREKTQLELEEEDWQANLSDWKSKMRRKSAASYERALSSEEPEITVDESKKAKVKSFKEMVETKPETKRRAFNIYPYGDEEEEPVFSSSSRKSLPSSLKDSYEYEDTSTAPSDSYTSKYETDDFKYKTEDYKSEKVTKSESYEQPVLNNGNHGTSQITTSYTTREESDYKPRTSNVTSRYSPEKRFSPEKEKPRSSPEKVLTDPPKKLKDRWPLDSNSGPAPWQRRSPDSDRSSKSPAREEREGSEDRGQRISLKERMERLHEKQSTEVQKTELDVKPSRLSSLRSAFEKQDSQPDVSRSSAPKRVIRNVEDVPSFKENLAERELNRSPSLERDYENLSNRNVQEVKQMYNEYNSSNVMDYTPPKYSRESAYQAYNPPQDSRSKTDYSQYMDSVPGKDSYRGYTSVDDDYQATAAKEDYLSDSSGTQSSSTERKNYVEKTIKIKIPPAHPKGFGFTIKGGKESSAPIVVDKVRIGTAADVCELLAGDEITQINGAEVGKHYKESVELVIDNAVKVGLVDLKVRRYLTQADIFDDDEYGTVQRRPDIQSLTKEENGMQNGWSEEEEEEKEGEKEEEMDLEEEERLEAEIMAQLEEEERAENEMEERHRQVLQEEETGGGDPEGGESERGEHPIDHPSDQHLHHQHQSLHVRLMQTEAPPAVEEEEEEEEDTPPALPSQPPPAPNWSTFPGGTPPQPATDLSFLDSTDLVPDSQPEPPSQTFQFCGIDEADLDEATRTKISMLKRRSDFLGVNLEDMEEYRKLQEDFIKEKEEEEARRRREEEEERQRQRRREEEEEERERQRRREEERERKRRQEEEEERERQRREEEREKERRWNEAKRETSGGYSYGPSRMLEQQEREILDTLEKEEAQLRNTHLDSVRNSVPKSLSNDDIEQRAMRDMESTVHNRRTDPSARSSRSFFNLDEEKKRMQQWAEEQERMRQKRYSREQEEMKQKFMEDLKRSEEIEAQKKEQEEKLLERELAHQRELEALAVKQQEERERRRREAEEERKREQQERKRQEQVQKRLLEEQQLQEEMELKNRLALRAQEIELNQDATTTIQQLYPWRVGAVERRSAERELAKKKQEREQRASSEQSQEQVQEQLERQRMRMEEMRRQEEEERRRYDEEKRRREEEKRQREMEETKLMKHKEEQLRLMEEKIKHEAEKLRKDREFLIKEKEEQERIKREREEELAVQQQELRQKQQEIERMKTSHRDDYSQPLKIDTTRPQYEDSRYPQQTVTYNPARPSYDPSVNTYSEHRHQDVPDGQPPKPAPKAMPIQKKPLNLRRDIPIPAPKPSASVPRQPDYLSRNQVLEMNKKPGASDWPPRQPQIGNSTEEIRLTRPTIEYKLERSPKRGETSPTWLEAQAKMRDESRVLNRQSWGREASPGLADNTDYQPTDIHSLQARSPTKQTVGDLGGPPPRKPYPNQNWIKSEDDRQMKLSDSIKAAYSGNLGQHWVIQEAERRRLAEVAARSQQPTGYADLYPTPTHVMEHPATPEGDRPSRPIPDSIKQTLIQRVNSPKSPGGSAPSYPPGQYSGYPEQYTNSPTSAYSQSSGYHSYENRPEQHSYDSHDWSPGYDQRAYDQRGYDQRGYNHPGYGASTGGPQGYNGAYEQNSRIEQQPQAPAKPPRSLLVKSESGGSRAEQVVSVDGHQMCSGCDQELGQGAAMIIESLNLYYHLQCFRCCVCHAPLGQGHQGADVRVRVSKLHCQNCYSNDEVGLKFSQV